MWVKGKLNVLCLEDFVFTLCLLGAALQGCQGFGRRGRGSPHRGQSGTSCPGWSTVGLFSIQNMCSCR